MSYRSFYVEISCPSCRVTLGFNARPIAFSCIRCKEVLFYDAEQDVLRQAAMDEVREATAVNLRELKL